jgi:predicted dithiol-disulfide oxidoreductase (DUF899 family)
MQTKMQESQIHAPKIVSPKEWIAARKELLAAEKEFTRQRDAISARRRELPWVKVETNYIFDGPNGKVSLSDLFRDKSQLVIYHFMLGPDWKEGCPSCSYLGDHFGGSLVHLNARDVAFSAVSLAPMPQIAAFKKRMGWDFQWVSSNANSFNYDYHVSFAATNKIDGKVNYNYTWMEFPSEEAPGLSVFYRNADGEIFHTYSTYGRGLDILLGAYNFLDMTPKGRDEGGLAHTMAWVRHHDRYDNGYEVDASAGYQEPDKLSASADSSCCHDKPQ